MNEYSFDSNKVKNELVEWIKEIFEANGRNCNAIIGISGGKDSSVVAALCVEALGRDRVIGVLMPDGEQSDIDYAIALIDFLGIRRIDFDIGRIREVFLNKLCSNVSVSEQTRINLPPRIRMTALYAIAQSMNGRVMNTCNLSEDWVGYSTRYGDSVGDFSPLAQLTTDEVIAVGEACGLPSYLCHKVPTDGLCGKTDEDNLGFSYSVLNKYIRTNVCDDSRTKKIIDELHEKNRFKLLPMPYFPNSSCSIQASDEPM